MRFVLPAHLQGHSEISPCYDPSCAQATKQNPQTGRWFITIGHAGFNTRANNASGYETQGEACAALRRHIRRTLSAVATPGIVGVRVVHRRTKDGGQVIQRVNAWWVNVLWDDGKTHASRISELKVETKRDIAARAVAN